jgi:hypothetical protein
MIVTNGVQRILVMMTYPTRFVPMIMAIYLVFVRNDEILAIVENSSFYDRVHTKLVETLKGNHSNGFKAILVGFGVRTFVVVDHDVELLVNLLSKIPFYCVVTPKSIPPKLEGGPLKPLKGITVSFVQPIVPCFIPFKRPLNYLEYKKDFDLGVHVQVFKVTIRVNGETVDEEITNMLNFTLKDNASN